MHGSGCRSRAMSAQIYIVKAHFDVCPHHLERCCHLLINSQRNVGLNDYLIGKLALRALI